MPAKIPGDTVLAYGVLGDSSLVGLPGWDLIGISSQLKKRIPNKRFEKGS